MSREFQYLLDLLDCTIHKKEPKAPEYDIDWSTFSKVALSHVLLSIVYPALIKISNQVDIPEDLLAQWKSYTANIGFAQIRKRTYLLDVLRTLNKKELPVMLIKGPFLSDMYPVPNARMSVDSDIVIREEDKEVVRDILLNELNYTAETGVENENEETFYFKDSHIEVHTCMWEELIDKNYNEKFFNCLNELELSSFEKAEHSTVNGVPVLAMNISNSFLYMIFHTAKHFYLCGAGARYLSDMTLFIEKYSDQIDWAEFWERAELLNYSGFSKVFFMLCIKYLSLDASLIKGMTEQKNTENLMNAMISDIEEGGHSGKSTPERNGMNGMIAACTVKKGGKVKVSMFNFINQKRHMLDRINHRSNVHNPETHSEEGHKFHLFTFIQYVFHKIFNIKKNTSENGDVFVRMREIEKRANLMKDLDLL